jgi:hypothetical protein
MSANHELERRIADFYASEAELRAPDRVLSAALTTIENTEQRGGRFGTPWRFRFMPTYARVAVAAVAVVVAGVLGLAVLRPGSAPGPGGPVTTPSPSSAPSPSSSVEPSPSAYVPPELTNTFSSDVHGLSISYPSGWLMRAATGPWTADTFPKFEDSSADVLYDPARTDHLFLHAGSQPLAGRSLETWAANVLAVEDCGTTEPVTVDGHAGVIGPCGMAAVSAGDRGYVIRLYVSSDDPEMGDFDALAWFEQILATVQLRPELAVDAAPSAAPSASP